MSSYIKANWNELEIGKNYYFEIIGHDHKPFYKKVKVIDLTDKQVIYKYEDNWKEYIRKNQWNEICLYKEDEQLRLFNE